MGITETVRRFWRDDKLRYLVVGGWNTFFGYASFAVPYWLLGRYIHYLVIAVFAHLTAVSQSFVTQRTLVFRSRDAWLPQYVRFQVAQLGLLGAGLVAMPFLVEICGLSPLVAQFLWLMVVVSASYVIHKTYSFRHARAGTNTSCG